MVPDARGLVPVRFFQSLGKTAKGDRSSDGKSSGGLDHDSGFSEGVSSSGTRPSIGSPQQQTGGADRMSKMGGKGSGAMVYGIVMYDFAAERPDELEAKAGEAIIVIAQSNPEWFVAKPIGRLGGPGLIPVSFIEIRDMVTGKPVEDATEAVQRAGVPKVEEWKRMAAEYKNSSIELGRLAGEEGSEGRQSLQAQARQSQQQQQQQQMGQGQQAYVSSNLILTTLMVELQLTHLSSIRCANPSKSSPPNKHKSNSNHNSNKATHLNNNITHPPYLHPSRPLFLDTSTQMRSTGLSLDVIMRTALCGNCNDTMKTSTTFRLRYSRNSPQKQETPLTAPRRA